MKESPRPIFVGRHALADDLAHAAKIGQARIVTGEPGIGKSQLLARVAEMAGRDRQVVELIATGAAASLPLGAFLPVIDRVETTFEAATRLRLTLVKSRPLVTVDDAHLLDPASAGLILDLSRAGVPVLLSLTERRPVDEAIDAIERLCGSPRITIPPLTDSEIARLIKMRLGGNPDPAFVAMIRYKSGGIPLYVEEILHSLIDSDRIGQELGTVYVVGLGSPVPRTTARSQGAQLSPDGLRVARFVGLARGLPEPIVRVLCPRHAVEEAEAAGLIEVRTEAGVVALVPRNDWASESLTTAMPRSVRIGLLAELVDALPAATPDDLLLARAVRWKAELGRAVPGGELLDAAARVQADAPAEADLLLDLVADHVGSPEDRLRLAALLAQRHRSRDAESVLAGLDSADLPTDLRCRKDMIRAFVRFFPANDPMRALDLLRSHAGADDPLLRAHLATALLQSGDIPAAIGVGSRVLADPATPVLARAHAALTVSSALVHAGRITDYEALRCERNRLITRAGDDLPVGAESARLVDESAFLEMGEDLDAAQSLAHASFERCLAHEDDGMGAQHSHLLARIALERGAPNEAVHLAIGVVVAQGLWAQAFHAWTSATLVEALVLSGRPAEAAEHLARASARRRSPIYDIDLARAAAVLRAAEGDLDAAAEGLTAAATQALARGQYTRARNALDQGVRYGSDASARALLRLRPPSTNGAVVRSQGLARGWLHRDPIALEATAEDHAAHGLLWRAIETSALAARAGGRSNSPAVAGLHTRCPSLRSPVVAQRPITMLTPRETDLAVRAAAHHSDAEIARDTGLSIRTVQTHLSNVYHKLGIGGRAELVGRMEDGSVVRSRAGT